MPKRVLALQRGDRLNGMGAANRRGAGFGKTKISDLALLNQFLDRAGDVFDGDGGVDAVLIEQVDGLRAKTPERTFDGEFDVIGPAVEPRRRGFKIDARLDVKPELGRNDDLLSNGRQRFADELFVGERPVDLGRVEKT